MAETMPTRYIGVLCQAVTLLLMLQFNLRVTRAQDAIGAINTNFTSSSGVRIPTSPIQPIKPPPDWPVKKPFNDRSARPFIFLSTSVYAAATLDMRESLSLRPHFHEDDPLARPFSHLPAPAYYTTGTAFATGVNWIGWKMARTERLHGVWWLPQLCSIAGNMFGYGYTRRHEHSR
jgi:hypothetical protein